MEQFEQIIARIKNIFIKIMKRIEKIYIMVLIFEQGRARAKLNRKRPRPIQFLIGTNFFSPAQSFDLISLTQSRKNSY